MGFSSIDNSSSDGDAFASRVIPNRTDRSERARLIATARTSHKRSASLTEAPAIVASTRDHVDFLSRVLADICRKESSRDSVEVKPPWVSQSDRPEFRAYLARLDRTSRKLGLTDEGIVWRNRVGP